MANENKRIPQLPVLAAPMAGDKLVIYDNATGLTKAIDVSYFLASLTSENFTYQPAKAYSFEDVAVYGGKWWSSLVAGVDTNTGNTPTEGAFWTEVSPSASGFVAWSAGMYTATVNYVIGSLDGYDQMFKLVAATPYNSSNLAQEYAAGDWELMSERGYIGVNKTAHGFALNDVLTFKTGAWNKFLPGDIPIGIVKSVVSANLVIVFLTGDRIKALSGLTPGSIYYAQPDATITVDVTDYPLFLAISATEAILLGGYSAAGGTEHFRGAYATLGALQAAVPAGDVGDYAYVDAGPANDVELYIWDNDDTDWVLSGSGGTTPDATESTKGKAEIATQSETDTGTDDTRIVTPLKMKRGLTKSRTVSGTDSIVQADNPYVIYFDSATPFNFTIDQLLIDSEVSFINIGAGAVTFIAGAGVTISGATSLAPDGSAVVLYRTATNPIIRAGVTVPDQAEATIKGRANGAGTGQPTALTADEVSTILDSATDAFLRRSAYENLLLAGSATPGRYATNVLSLVPAEGNAAFSVGAIRAYVFLVSKEITITRIQTNVTSAAASALYRLGIYADNGSLYPGDLVAGTDVQEYDGSSTGVKESSAISITLPAGLYWVAVHTDTTINLRAWTSQYLSPLGILNTGTGQNQANSYSLTTPYAAMPSTFPGSAVVTNANPPKLGMLI